MVSGWVARVRHDLVKRLLWPARDRRDLGGPVQSGELIASLIDDDGHPTTAQALWRAFVDEAPSTWAPALARFELALNAAVAAATRDDLPGVLALEPAFERLAQDVNTLAAGDS